MIRGITLRGAISLNVITMIGIGPLITIPLVLQKLAGPLALAGWLAGALIALCDGLVWAELGSQYPGAGGTYAYLRDIFGAQRWGRMLAFLYNWQYFLSASLIIATGYIGFADYAAYLWSPLAANGKLTQAVAAGIGVVSVFMVYRRITAVAKLGIGLAGIAVVTILLVGIAGFAHGDIHRAFTLPANVSFGWGFIAGLASALYITLYDYGGYSQVALVGEEIHKPERTLPRSIVASIFIVLALYLFLQIGVLSGIPWQSLFDKHGAPTTQSTFVGSIVAERAWGAKAAIAVTVLILITAFASLYGNLVGAARVPFAAARDGAFLAAFAKLHERDQFPHVSLLAIGAISIIACFFTLDQVIAMLSAAGILIGNVAQIVALFVMRARHRRAPFRMWLYPIPALLAIAGWIYAFIGTGATAMLLGMLWQVIGVAIYLVLARLQRMWPFAAAAALALVVAAAQPASARPAFVYAASFFYERVPRSQWKPSLERYHALGINTIDLYVMWNWHELRDGDFDFTGRTNARRDLRGLLALIHREGFALILRPGPVIRNEWRNGGYPAWLLKRPDYAMPLRDVLEGRYPATATLQNAHSDAAAAQWMRNATHMRYATRWLQRALSEAVPYRSDIVAVALDDDQGAYIDNDTWPGPHFHRYISYLAAVTHRVLPSIPVFINTYQMKVTASAPVWAWGNWYQSDAYSIGEHDRAQIEFSTGLLQTQPRSPAVMISEFQAGWLQNADQPRPRPADPSNTTLALHTFLQMGAHGVVNFPVQDTLNPAGWEAPWTNAFYSWDAALSVQLTPQPRFGPTQRFGALVARYGPALAQTMPAADAAIAYTTSAYDERRISNAQIAQIAQATLAAQEDCRAARITCSLVDLRFATQSQLFSHRALIVPQAGIALPMLAPVRARLAAYGASGRQIVSRASAVRVAHPAAGGVPNAVLLVANNERYGFLDIVNYGSLPLRTRRAHVHAGRFEADVAQLTVPARDAVLVPLHLLVPTPAIAALPPAGAPQRLPLRAGSWIAPDARDIYQDGYPAAALRSGSSLLVVSPCAGGRALVFEDLVTGANVFTTVGGLRDAWTPRLPPSNRDYIAKYTHPIATGTFNRCYALRRSAGALALSYDAPDAPLHGARFEKDLSAVNGAFAETLYSAFAGAPAELAQQLTSFSIGPSARVLRAAHGYGFYDLRSKRLVMVAWEPLDVRTARLERHSGDALLTLTLEGGGPRHVWFRITGAGTAAQAGALLRSFCAHAMRGGLPPGVRHLGRRMRPRRG